MPYPISLQPYTIRELLKADYFGAMKQVAEIGYVGIEGGPPAGTSDADFKKFLDDVGLRISSVWAWPTSENISQIVDRASFFGYRHITNGFNEDALKTSAQIQSAGEKCKAAAELLAAHGLQFCVHNHWYEFDRLDGELVEDRLLRAAGDGVAMELDLYWASNFGVTDVPAYVAANAARIPLMHVKDGPLIQHQPNTAVGSGKFDVTRAIAAADPAVLKYLVVELDQYVGGHANVMEAVRDSYRWLVKSGLGTGRK